MRIRRVRATAATATTLVAVLLAGCSSTASEDPVTVKVTVPASEDGNGRPSRTTTTGTSADPGSSSAVPSSTAPSGTPAPSTTPRSSASSSAPLTPSSQAEPGDGSFDNPQDGVALPDGYIPRKLKAGEKPPQFVIVSFDGVGWNEKWQYWFGISKKVPFRFTGFLSGTYMLSEGTKDHYKGPQHAVGASDINWNLATDLPIEINDINQALDSGMEIGTHFNGHFCGPGGGSEWSTADWNNELDQFFGLIKDYKSNNPDAQLPTLKLKAADITGERTPCLEGHAEDLYPALTSHKLEYDSSFTRRGITWPTKSADNGIWQFGMAEFPMHGTITGNTLLDPAQRNQHVQITMDYNFWYSQEGVNLEANTPTDPAQSAKDSQQVVQTYEDMYNAALAGNRAPLVLGNHFNQWNNNAYSDAIGKFVTDTCGKADTQCVPFRDVIAWMKVQDPARLAQLQAQEPELGQTTG
ncbi:MAG: hypothetical protein WKF57_08175 [Nakamurella sp.]